MPLEVEAMFWQFEDQIGDMVLKEEDLGSIEAKSRFTFLPPAGLLPVNLREGAKTFNPSTFFGVESSPRMIDGVQLRGLFHDARFHEPVDPSKEPVQWYVVSDNVKAVLTAIQEKKDSGLLSIVFARLSVPAPEHLQDVPEGLGRLMSQRFR